MPGHPYYGYGAYPPPPPPGSYPPPPAHGQPMYPGIGVAFYPVHPAYFYPPYPPNPASIEPVQVVDSPEEAVPELPGETVELPWSTYRWVPACLSQRSIPPGALRVGTDQDGDEIYAGRAHHAGDVLPAKVIPSKNACYISFEGEEILVDQFEVLVPAMFSWQFSTNGEVPPGAVEAGVTSSGEKLYFGRVTHDGCTTPGKIHPSHGTCYYPFDGEERSSNEYEALVLM
ncbi:uncharacterized protein LOC126370298 [Pectinophora gossypiella]|uniref:uncharacterized protein LOC126370298 n=1 Tax=Pectinophora gossypiella TaxID=13191 RepID=UPI00214F3A6C|nr:uncharacterized protein LOC126370298 [Pectinophora gossypiella]